MRVFGRIPFHNWILPATLLLLSIAVVRPTTCPARNSLENEECVLYLANSTIPNGGVGIFTSVELTPGEEIGYGDVMNPWIDFIWHRPVEFMTHKHPFFDYVWEGINVLTLESADRLHNDTVQIMGFGLEAAINCHLALVNTYISTIEHNDCQLNRALNPGVGAFSPYISGKTRVAAPIPQGGEVFKMYGDEWFRSRSNELVPLSEDYPQADTLVQKFGHLFPQANQLSKLNNLHRDLWDLMANFPYPSRTISAIPKRHDRILLTIQEGIWESYEKDSIRPVEELKRLGRCLDNISHGPSTLPQASRGAFATRSFSAGSIITGSPVLHVKGMGLFEMYKGVFDMLARKADGDPNTTMPDMASIRNYQIALNYCWKHPQSTMLLCPYGAGVNFINHNKILANVKVKWAPHGQIGHDSHALQQTLAELMQSYKPRLAFDYVATRDIELGDELFLDYGMEWELAWREHVSQYPKYSTETHYQSARQWNDQHALSDIRTNAERRLEPYPSNFELRCHPGITTLAMFPLHFAPYAWTIHDVGAPCSVLQRAKASNTSVYTVGIEHQGKAPQDCFCTVVKDVPRGALRLFDRPYTTDLLLPSAFRQPIGIPDDLFPAIWKNDS